MKANKPQQKYNCFGVIFNANKKSTNPSQELALLQSLLLKSFYFVATIIHDQWSESELLKKERTTIHLHAYIETEAKYTEKQFLQQLQDITKYQAEQITLEGSNNDILLLQYLTHKNDNTKYQFSNDSIITNNVDLYNTKYETIYKSKEQRTNELTSDIRNCKTLLELIEKQGLETANKYRNVFNQVKTEQRLNYEDLERIARNLQEDNYKIIKELKDFFDFVEKSKSILTFDITTEWTYDRIKQLRNNLKKYF